MADRYHQEGRTKKPKSQSTTSQSTTKHQSYRVPGQSEAPISSRTAKRQDLYRDPNNQGFPARGVILSPSLKGRRQRTERPSRPLTWHPSTMPNFDITNYQADAATFDQSYAPFTEGSVSQYDDQYLIDGQLPLSGSYDLSQMQALQHVSYPSESQYYDQQQPLFMDTIDPAPQPQYLDYAYTNGAYSVPNAEQYSQASYVAYLDSMNTSMSGYQISNFAADSSTLLSSSAPSAPEQQDEELVGLGLYNDRRGNRPSHLRSLSSPPEQTPFSNARSGLLLGEGWQPPAELPAAVAQAADDEDNEDDDEDDDEDSSEAEEDEEYSYTGTPLDSYQIQPYQPGWSQGVDQKQTAPGWSSDLGAGVHDQQFWPSNRYSSGYLVTPDAWNAYNCGQPTGYGGSYQ